MKRCDNCILNNLDQNEFGCKKDLQAPECIGVLMGVIERMATNRFIADRPKNNDVRCRVDYYVDGEGSIYMNHIPSDEELALAIIEDCTEKEIAIEYVD